jgi:hypothetical protein
MQARDLINAGENNESVDDILDINKSLFMYVYSCLYVCIHICMYVYGSFTSGRKQWYCGWYFKCINIYVYVHLWIYQ